ncbi:MAG: polyphosphate kinase 2 family protein, partial [Hymenobacter sp.]
MAVATPPATPAVRVQPGVSFRLSDIDPDATAPFSKKKAEKRLEELREQLSDYQENLYAEHRQSLL